MAGTEGRFKRLVRRLKKWASYSGVVVFFAAWSWVPFGFAPFSGNRQGLVITLGGALASSAFGVLVGIVMSDEEWDPTGWVEGPQDLKAFNVALAGGLYLMILGSFATIYCQIGHEDPSAFRGAVDHVGAAYFAVTTFTTTGFGDIAPQDHLTRIVVSVQELMGLALIAVVIAALSSRLLEKQPSMLRRSKPAASSRDDPSA